MKSLILAALLVGCEPTTTSAGSAPPPPAGWSMFQLTGEGAGKAEPLPVNAIMLPNVCLTTEHGAEHCRVATDSYAIEDGEVCDGSGHCGADLADYYAAEYPALRLYVYWMAL
jgi:hypothetical protein